MIDTISYISAVPYDPVCVEELHNLFADRRSSDSSSIKNSRTTNTQTWSWPLIGLRLFSKYPNTITKIECELPKLLYGHNGRLIRSQSDLDRALMRLDRVLYFLSHPLADREAIGTDLPTAYKHHICRVDVVWQFDYPVQIIREVLSYAKHPRIHEQPDLYGNGNFTFNGKNMRISIYDKVAKRKNVTVAPSTAQSVCRIEFQIRSKKYVAERFNADTTMGLRSFTFDEAYQVYRDLLLAFSKLGSSSSTDSTTIASFLAAESARDPHIVQRYVNHMQLHPTRVSDLRKEIMCVKLQKFDLNSLVPPHAPPPEVEAVDDSAEKELARLIELHPELWP